jgi:hypothetical protein
MANVTGGGAPARIFSDIMAYAVEGIAPEPLPGAGLLELLPAEETIAAMAGAELDGVPIPTVETIDGEAPPVLAADQ